MFKLYCVLCLLGSIGFLYLAAWLLDRPATWYGAVNFVLSVSGFLGCFVGALYFTDKISKT